MTNMGEHTNLEPKSAAEYRQTADAHAQELKSFWKRFAVSGLFVIAAVIIIFACLAWFAANNRVQAESSGISAKAGRYTLVAEGEGVQGAKTGYYEQMSPSALGRLDITDAMTITLDSNLNNYSNGGIYPGARGKITFNVVPLAEDLNGVTIDLSRIVQAKNNSATGDTGFDETLDNLVKGHLLFFRAMDVNGFYSSRVENDTIELPKASFYPKNQDGSVASERTTEFVPITLYWVWPEHFQNFVLTGNTNYYRNLFTLDAKNGAYTSDYTSLQNAVNGNKADYFYGSSNGVSAANAPEVKPDMSSGNLAICADLYNQADEYLGDKAEYLQLRITAREGVNNG